jgi:hypothetical protein
MADGTATAKTNARPTTDAPAGEAAATEAPTSDVGARVAELRALAAESPTQARDAAWEWFVELGKETADDREGAVEKLNELFREGTPPAQIDGQTEGILVAPLIAGPVDAGLRRITGLWMPWLGKRFDRAASTGDNVLAGTARWPAKLLWPLYGTSPLTGGRAAFDFQTRVEPSKDDPETDVLVIDYEPVESNPNFIIRRIRDELVEVVPGANLGKVLWHSGDDGYSLIGFFALRTPVA